MAEERPEVADPTVQRTVRHVPADGVAEPRADRVVGEEPLEIRVGSRPLAVIMRTPGDDLDLAMGFLLTEGFIGRPAAVRRIAHCPADAQGVAPGGDEGNAVSAVLAEGAAIPEERWQRAITASSACGICGKVAIDDVLDRVPALESDATITRAVLLALPDRLRASQSLFAETGGLHGAGLFTPGGELLCLREDVGRHNAVDKVVGHYARIGGGQPVPPDSVLLCSGRAGFEILQKAAVAQIPIVAAIGAPTSLACELADEAGITLVAFLRPDRGSFNVYTHPARVVVM
ncbi:MAG: formate dehydrogenase accessory sulfurtransferase FdhD [Planctomycetota bacterium]|jgi:FdhD protein